MTRMHHSPPSSEVSTPSQSVASSDLCNAIATYDESLANSLLDSGANPNEIDQHKRNALHMVVVFSSSKPLFNRILDLMQDVNAAMSEGSTALYLATHHDKQDFVNSLLSHPDINPNVQDYFESTALHCAVRKDHLNIVEQLLSHPLIDLTIKDDYNNTPLDVANNVKGGRPIIAQKLMEHLHIISTL